MDKQRRKELIGEYKTRQPEMDVVSYVCTMTGEMFLSAAKDTKADVNSTLTKLESGFIPTNVFWNFGRNMAAMDSSFQRWRHSNTRMALKTTPRI